MTKYLLVLGLVLVSAIGMAGTSFEKVPAAARAALSGARGRKAVKTGFVFANGHYVKPPYRIARQGTAIFVNNEQVTDQIVSWKTFLAAANGVSSAPPPAAPAASEPKKEAPSADAKPSAGTSVDDLFDDEEAQPVAPRKKAPAAAPKPPLEPEEESAEPFTANAQTDKLLKRVNAYRTEVSRRLSAGNVCFFGARYGQINVPPRLARRLLAVLPEAMRDATDADALYAAMRKNGFAFMSRELCEDLIANRADYLALLERRKRMEADAAFQKALSDMQP